MIDGVIVQTINEFLEKYRKKNGESLECLCDHHASCNSTLRCTECGTVIRYYYDEAYEPDFRCPVCTDYGTEYEFWTVEEIDGNITNNTPQGSGSRRCPVAFILVHNRTNTRGNNKEATTQWTTSPKR
jgi:hypothetical protein